MWQGCARARLGVIKENYLEAVTSRLFLKIGLVLTKGKPESLSLHWADPEKRDPGISEEQRSPVSASLRMCSRWGWRCKPKLAGETVLVQISLCVPPAVWLWENCLISLILLNGTLSTRRIAMRIKGDAELKCPEQCFAASDHTKYLGENISQYKTTVPVLASGSPTSPLLQSWAPGFWFQPEKPLSPPLLPLLKSQLSSSNVCSFYSTIL